MRDTQIPDIYPMQFIKSITPYHHHSVYDAHMNLRLIIKAQQR